jgi:hypothetical protein
MDLNRFETILEAYGAEPAHWPLAERAAALDLAKTQLAAAMLADARDLDSLLAAERSVSPTAAVRVRVRVAAPGAGAGRWRRLAGLAGAAGLVGALLAGAAAGVAVAARQTRAVPAAVAGDPAFEAARDLAEPPDPDLAP